MKNKYDPVIDALAAVLESGDIKKRKKLARELKRYAEAPRSNYNRLLNKKGMLSDLIQCIEFCACEVN